MFINFNFYALRLKAKVMTFHGHFINWTLFCKFLKPTICLRIMTEVESPVMSLFYSYVLSY